MTGPLQVRSFPGYQDYRSTWQAMQDFTAARTARTIDEVWFLEHEPVYTLGQAGDSRHLLAPGAIPVVRTDRGGQVTWHGPGQLMMYLLLDTRRHQLGPRRLVGLLEQVLVDLLASLGLEAHARTDAPGVYLMQQGVEAKIAAIGLRIRQQGCYHGLALNLDCDLAAFAGIHPCGHPGWAVTRLCDCLAHVPDRSTLEQSLCRRWAEALDCDDILYRTGYD